MQRPLGRNGSRMRTESDGKLRAIAEARQRPARMEILEYRAPGTMRCHAAGSATRDAAEADVRGWSTMPATQRARSGRRETAMQRRAARSGCARVREARCGAEIEQAREARAARAWTQAGREAEQRAQAAALEAERRRQHGRRADRELCRGARPLSAGGRTGSRGAGAGGGRAHPAPRSADGSAAADGAVRVALGQLSATTEVRLRVPAGELDLWTEAIALVPNLRVKPAVVAGEGMRLGDCVIETQVGLGRSGNSRRSWARSSAASSIAPAAADRASDLLQRPRTRALRPA